MTDPSTEPTKIATRSRTAGIRPVLVLIFRLLLLGVGSAVALLIGILLAQLSPGTVNEKPLLEDLLRGVARLRGAPYPQVNPSLGRPEDPPRELSSGSADPDEGAADSGPAADTSSPDPQSPDTQPDAETNSPAVGQPSNGSAGADGADGDAANGASPPGTGSAASPNTAPDLSPQARQALQQQLDQIQTEQQSLETAIARLEAQVGIEPSTRPLNERMAELERRIGRTQE
ncbi:MAG: hypothetical protein AAF289_15405 [Cyanobacteria bacterium P01_A01_bin.135]